MTLFLVSLVVSLVVIAVMAWAYRASKKSAYFPAVLAPLGIVLVFRTIFIAPLGVHGYFLLRPLTAAATAGLWFGFVVLAVVSFVTGAFYSRLPQWLFRWGLLMQLVQVVGVFLLFWAVFSPFTWVTPLWVVVLLIVSAIIALVETRRAVKFRSIGHGIAAVIAAIFFMSTWLHSMHPGFWSKDLPADAGRQFCFITQGHPHGYCFQNPNAANGQAKGSNTSPQAHPSTIYYKQKFYVHARNRVHNTATITAICSSKDACLANVRKNKLFAQSYANKNNAEVTLIPMVGNDRVGDVIKTAPTGLADIQYGAVAGDPCSLGPTQAPGEQKVNQSTHQLVCTVVS